jgi:uncharacterized membrane protein
MMWSYYWWSSDRWPMPSMSAGPIMMIIFVVICTAIMYHMMHGEMMRHAEGRHPLDILWKRYARGEITPTEYEYQRRLLDY